MNRPEKRNALSGEMLAIMSDAWDRVNEDDDVRVAILTGAGGSFCAGADLEAMTKSSPSDSFESGEFDPSVIKSLLKGFRLTKPLIAAVEGPAIAGGTEILQATDIRVAGESARFGVSEPRWGLYPLGGSAVRLPRQIPYTVAADLLLTGRHIKAPEAKELGLIGHVVPDGEALAKAHELAGLVAANGPLAVRAVLKTIRDSEGKHENDCWPTTPPSARPSSPPRTPRRARGRSWRSGRRSSRVVDSPLGPAGRRLLGRGSLGSRARGRALA